MGRPRGVKGPREPETESEQLAYYRALHFLQQSTAEEDAANDALITVYRKQCQFIDAIRPFTRWEEIAEILGIPRTTLMSRYQNYRSNNDQLE